MTGDGEAPNDEVQYHVELAEGDVDGPVLLPGDPDRVEVIAVARHSSASGPMASGSSSPSV